MRERSTRTHEIADFFINESGYVTEKDRAVIERFIKKHDDLGTLLVLRDKYGIIASGRWNYLDGETAFILDLVIRRNHKGILKSILKLFKWKRPEVNKIAFERKEKYPERPMRVYDIGRMM